MTQFYEGQEIEVLTGHDCLITGRVWSRARIIRLYEPSTWEYCVEFPDGTRTVANAEHIRAVDLDVPEIIMVQR
jgi:hypothetical protein